MSNWAIVFVFFFFFGSLRKTMHTLCTLWDGAWRGKWCMDAVDGGNDDQCAAQQIEPTR